MQKHFKGFSPCICKLAKNVIFFYYTMEDSLKYCGSNKQESFSFLGTFFTEQKSNILFHYRHNSSPKFLSTNVCLALSSNIQSLREMINVARQEMHSGNSGQPKGMDDTMVENDNTISLISCQLLEIMHVLCCLRWILKGNILFLAKCTPCFIECSFHLCTMNPPRLLSGRQILIKAWSWWMKSAQISKHSAAFKK